MAVCRTCGTSAARWSTVWSAVAVRARRRRVTDATVKDVQSDTADRPRSSWNICQLCRWPASWMEPSRT